MNINGKYALLGKHLLDRIEVVPVNPEAKVENDNGTIRVEVAESTTSQIWRIPADSLGSRAELEKELLNNLLWHCRGLIESRCSTKREKLQLLQDYLGIDFPELNRKNK